jgi:hypothetical protein
MRSVFPWGSLARENAKLNYVQRPVLAEGLSICAIGMVSSSLVSAWCITLEAGSTSNDKFAVRT